MAAFSRGTRLRVQAALRCLALLLEQGVVAAAAGGSLGAGGWVLRVGGS